MAKDPNWLPNEYISDPDEFDFVEFDEADNERLTKPATLLHSLIPGMRVAILEELVRHLEAQIEQQAKMLRAERRMWALVSLFSLLAGLVTATLLF